ncbi:biotin transporter BioY [Caldibacillus thermolactis]|uniref:Biotin transporter n=1 Tax=Pallidibacillus thermolactis TaxID=251051 RepID=A0ABT2WGD7_9BACI|nr:biotin transporter BioY [Pallidibacillus thermolactis]MCU9594756.1 biotin transporter BioY [Pallidibacillus thermolactis]
MKGKLKTIEITLISLFVVLIAIGANITTIAPFLIVGGVPITLQTFFAILAGLILGSRLGVMATTVYMIGGLIGLPLFAQFRGGIAALFFPTFGFILSFILAAFVCGKIVKNKKTVTPYIIAALVGTAINYVVGTNWMYFAYLNWAQAPEGFSYGMAWLWMIAPLPKDIILAFVAGIIAHRMHVSVLTKGQFQHLRTGA